MGALSVARAQATREADMVRMMRERGLNAFLRDILPRNYTRNTSRIQPSSMLIKQKLVEVVNKLLIGSIPIGATERTWWSNFVFATVPNLESFASTNLTCLVGASQPDGTWACTIA